jgi:hypothetical protein
MIKEKHQREGFRQCVCWCVLVCGCVGVWVCEYEAGLHRDIESQCLTSLHS